MENQEVCDKSLLGTWHWQPHSSSCSIKSHVSFLWISPSLHRCVSVIQRIQPASERPFSDAVLDHKILSGCSIFNQKEKKIKHALAQIRQRMRMHAHIFFTNSLQGRDINQLIPQGKRRCSFTLYFYDIFQEAGLVESLLPAIPYEIFTPRSSSSQHGNGTHLFTSSGFQLLHCSLSLHVWDSITLLLNYSKHLHIIIASAHNVSSDVSEICCAESKTKATCIQTCAVTTHLQHISAPTWRSDTKPSHCNPLDALSSLYNSNSTHSNEQSAR